MEHKTDTDSEREAFEAALKKLCEGFGELLGDEDLAVTPSGAYINGTTEVAWMLWQARASLAARAGSEPVAGTNEYGVRGYLAATLKCWHRLTGDEAAELVAMTQRLAGLYTHPSPPEGMVGGWMPIENAPKDGVAVLVMRDIWPGAKSGRAEECNGHNTYVAAWWSGERGGQGAWICYMDAVCDPICPIEPTHWMPLPAPPIAAGGGKDAGHE